MTIAIITIWILIGAVAYLYGCYQDRESGIIEINVLEFIGAATSGPILPLALLLLRANK